MPARTGNGYLQDLNESARDVRVHGERVTTGIADHPAFRGVTHAYAALFDLQHDPRYEKRLTYLSPTSGDRVGFSFLQPRTEAELRQRAAGSKLWSDSSFGMLGRTGDYLNAALMAMSSARDWFGAVDSRFAENVQAYYELIREHDLLLTHTLINRQSNRAVGPSAQKDPYQAAVIVDRNEKGIV
ncbi:MAG: 4-hydroxyphenylacetate 3-hydroxylase N-terminal domain-containing protein, partial [Solirubrobacteraceae bacterium]